MKYSTDVLRRVTLTVLALLLVIGLASAQDTELVPRYTVMPPAPGSNVAALKLLGPPAALQTWTGSFTYNGGNYSFTMMGTDPSKGSATTTVNFIIVPLALKFSDGTLLDPNANTQCGGTSSALKLTTGSPIFQNVNWTQGGTNVGTTQYEDAFQRAEFWGNVSTTSPNYHVLLHATVAPLKITVNVPAADGSTATGSCGKYGMADINWYDNELQNLMEQYRSKITPDMFIYFLTYDVFETEGGCCVLGYHGISVTNNVYGTGAFTDQNIFGPPNENFDDIVTISHEVGEAINDPYIDNVVPNWISSYAPQYGCNNSLEVGDPLAGLPEGPIMVKGNSHAYYVQDLAFLPWFEKASKSSSVNGWYSMYGTFKTGSSNCN